MVKLSPDFIVILMIFMHILDDFDLQGILGNLKQKTWWKKNYPDTLYKYDYLAALLIHSFSWTFMIMLPIAYYLNFQLSLAFKVCFSLNIIYHAIIDDAKANALTINLVIDQFAHILQIITTFIICVLI